MSTAREVALRLAVLRVLADLLQDGRASADAEARDALEPEDRLTAKLPSGEKVAAVSMTRGRTSAKVTDRPPFTAWVMATYPDEVEQVTRVRPAFEAKVLANAKTMGAPVDPATGEEIPGVELAVSEPHPSVRLADGAREAVGRAWRDGDLAELVGGLLAIEEAPGE